jgi:class 3 adenylate cyclase
MPALSAKERAALPNSAFAYIDSTGRRLLPIHDAAHVRAAFARFGRVSFENEESRDKARMRLLRAAKKHGIMPLGFIGMQLRPENKLPRGHVTFLLTDIEGSTELVHRLGDGYSPILNQLRRLQRTTVREAGGREIDARGDEFFAVFEKPAAAVEAAVAMQRAIHAHPWGDEIKVLIRIGIHHGRPTLAESGYIGLAVHTVARVATSAHGGQIVLSAAARDAVGELLAEGLTLVSLGSYRLSGLRESIELLQVRADDLIDGFPPPRPVAMAGHR